MPQSKKTKTFQVHKGKFISEDAQEVTIPDEALDYIVSRFLQEKNKGDFPVVIGVSSHTVEIIIQLLIDWANINGHVKNGIMVLGNNYS